MEVLRYNATTSCFVQPAAIPRKENARRRLNFGTTPTTCAQEANDLFLQEALARMTHEYSCKWEFDFHAGQPLPSSSNSRFQYKILESTDTPILYSPVSAIEEENLSDSENCPQRAKLSVNVELKPLESSEEFVYPPKSPKKVLKKPAKHIYSTPKKARDMQLTDFMSYRKRRSINAKGSPFKSPRSQNTNRVSYSLRRHSLAN